MPSSECIVVTGWEAGGVEGWVSGDGGRRISGRGGREGGVAGRVGAGGKADFVDGKVEVAKMM